METQLVHNYNAPPTALREVSVGKTTMSVKQWGNKIDGRKKKLRTGSRVREQSFVRGRVWQEKAVSMHAKSLSVTLSSRWRKVSRSGLRTQSKEY